MSPTVTRLHQSEMTLFSSLINLPIRLAWHQNRVMHMDLSDGTMMWVALCKQVFNFQPSIHPATLFDTPAIPMLTVCLSSPANMQASLMSMSWS
jgi:hypothetical protein